MDNDKQRIAIAEACGWTAHEAPKGLWYWYRPNTFPQGATPSYSLPDYLFSLDAMHGAEKVLNDEQVAGYFLELQKLIVPPYLKHFAPCIRATATQRAEALLRTLGKWEDSELSSREEVEPELTAEEIAMLQSPSDHRDAGSKEGG